MGPVQVQQLRVRVDLRAIAIKGYLVLAKNPALQEHHKQIIGYHIQDSSWAESYLDAVM